MKRRVLAFLLVFVMAASLMTVSASAEQIIDTWSCGGQTKYILYSNGVLEITGVGPTNDYTSPHMSDCGYYNDRCELITSIVIDDGITRIGNHLLSHLYYVKSVSIPTSVKSIGASAFSDLDALTSVTIPEGVVSIEKDAFSACDTLKTVKLPSTLTTIGKYAFSGTAIEKLELPESTLNIGEHAFSACHSLESVKLPSKLTTIPYGLFSNCWKLKSIDIPNTVTEIGQSAFNYCGFTGITIPESVEKIGSMAFMHCDDLVSAKLPSGLETISNDMFAYCGSLKSVELPAGITRIGMDSFRECSSLTSITIPEQVTYISDRAFADCRNLSEIYFLGSAPQFGNDVVFRNVTATVHYSGDDPSWTDVVRQNYGGNLTWVGDLHQHVYTIEEVITAPTCTEKGLKKVSCFCGASKTVEIDALGHNFDGHGCTRCGALNPEKCISAQFTDMVPETHWAHSAIDYVVSRGIMHGMGDGTFAPNGTVTRAMVAVMLHSLSGEPKPSGDNPFTDVKLTDWYGEAVIWAYENEIVSGMGDGTFNPSGSITREQLAIMMRNYAEFIGKDTSAEGNLSRFEDAESVSWWAEKEMKWAVSVGLISGSNEGGKLYLMPQGNATRAQIAVIFESFCEKFEV